jgi:hypothetical protein
MKPILTPTTSIILTAVCAVGLAGCVVSVGNGSKSARSHAVPSSSFASIVASHGQIELGMPRDEAIELFPRGSVSLKEARAVAHAGELHTYIVRARDTRSGLYYERWLYFANDHLVAFSDTRLETGDDVLVHGWFELVDPHR